MDNLTIGQYVPGNSWIYKVDPRLKIVLTLFWIILLFVMPMNIYAMLAYLAVIVVITLSTRIPVMKMIKGLKPIIFITIFTFILQLTYVSPTPDMVLYHSFKFSFGLYQLLTIIAFVLIGFGLSRRMPSKLIWWLFIIFMCFACQWIELLDKLNLTAYYSNMNWSNYSLDVYDQGLTRAFVIVIRIILMIVITSLLTFTTRNQEINQGVTSLLSPLKVFKVPVGTFGMMLSLSLRFIPTLIQETNKIIKAQASRGVDFAESKLSKKVNQIVSLLVPLFIVSFRKADDLANAMEARGYIMEGKRSSIDKLSFKWIDLVASVVSLCALAGVIVAKIYL